MAEWRIRKRENLCAGTGTPFDEGQVIYSLLLWREGALAREDHSVESFGIVSQATGDAAPLIFWRTRWAEKKKRGLAVDFDTVEALFMALANREEERLRMLRYLLGLLLMRKRRVKLLRVVRKGPLEFLRLRRPRREEQLDVEVFELDPETVASLREELTALFQGEISAEDLAAGQAEARAVEAETEEQDGADPSAGSGADAVDADSSEEPAAEEATKVATSDTAEG